MSRPRLKALTRLAAIAARVAVASLALPASQAGALPLLTHHGRWLIDPQGRVVILHGVQIDRFMPGSHEEGWIDVPSAGVGFIGAEGFNLARVSISYAGVEPKLGQFDDSYVRQFLAFDQQLAGAGVYDLVDMMQGQYAAQFDGDGFPSWMVITNGAPNIPRPFPQAYLIDPAEERAWDNLFANARASDGVGLQDHYARGLVHLDRMFSSEPAFLGLDLLNEPWPGTQWPTCANPLGCPVFDREMNAFYRRIVPALRAADPPRLVFYEPHGLFDFGAASNIGSIGDPRAVFTFHNYCLGDIPGLPQADPGHDCGIEEQLVLGEAETQAARGGDGLLEDEWGNTSSIPLLQRMTAEADQHKVGWSYWAYEDCCGSPGAIVYDGSKDPTAPGNLNLPVLGALVRPYPKLIAGTPQSWGYDPASGAFSLRYSTHPVAGGTFTDGIDTAVELPALRYPTGYTVQVTGAHVTSAPDANLLLLSNVPGASAVALAVTPADHHPPVAGRFSGSAPSASSTVAADCPSQGRQVIPVGTDALPVVRVSVYVDGKRVMTVRGGRVRRVTLPAGLADGSTIRLVAQTLGGRDESISAQVRGCLARIVP